MQRAFVIYNPASGQRRAQRLRHVSAAVDVLRAAGVNVEMAPTTHAGSAIEQASQAAQAGSGFDTILACGGDGTVNEVLNGLMQAGGNAVLGVIPLGSGNLLATDLRLPSSPVQAARQLLACTPREIHPGYIISREPGVAGQTGETGVHKRYFIVAAGVGADAQLMYRTAVQAKERFGRNAYFMEMFRMAVHGRFPAFEVEWQEISGQRHTARVTLVMAVRARRFPGLLRLVNLGSSLEHDHYRLMLFRTHKVARFLSYFASVATGRNWKVKDVDLVASNWFRCTALPSEAVIRAQADGEILGSLPVEAGIDPRPFRLLMP